MAFGSNVLNTRLYTNIKRNRKPVDGVFYNKTYVEKDFLLICILKLNIEIDYK